MNKSGLTELEVVLAVARRHGFRAAAVELDMSTSAVSNAVASLEARLGTRLFHRTTRSVSLTEVGRQFVDQIGPAVAHIQVSMASVSEHKATPTGTLRINSSLGAALMVFQPLVLEFLRRYPDMAVDIVTEGLLVDIIAEGFDAGLRVSSLVPLDMIRVPISGKVSMTVVGSVDYFARKPRPNTPDDLAEHQCIRARLLTLLERRGQRIACRRALVGSPQRAAERDQPRELSEAGRMPGAKPGRLGQPREPVLAAFDQADDAQPADDCAGNADLAGQFQLLGRERAGGLAVPEREVRHRGRAAPGQRPGARGTELGLPLPARPDGVVECLLRAMLGEAQLGASDQQRRHLVSIAQLAVLDHRERALGVREPPLLNVAGGDGGVRAREVPEATGPMRARILLPCPRWRVDRSSWTRCPGSSWRSRTVSRSGGSSPPRA